MGVEEYLKKAGNTNMEEEIRRLQDDVAKGAAVENDFFTAVGKLTP